MIYSLNGKLIYRDAVSAVIECGGVGYQCMITMNTARTLPKEGEDVRLFTYMSVHEDSVELIGFENKSELECFKLLTSVSGVGTRVGLAILSELLPEQVAMAVGSNDPKTLTIAPGVGMKLAQRIILELKDKIDKSSKGVGKSKAAPIVMSLGGGNVANAITALNVLGYQPADVTPILAQLDSSLSVEELIRLTLKQLAPK